MSALLAECLIFRQQGVVSEYFEKYPQDTPTQTNSNPDLYIRQRVGNKILDPVSSG